MNRIEYFESSLKRDLDQIEYNKSRIETYQNKLNMSKGEKSKALYKKKIDLYKSFVESHQNSAMETEKLIKKYQNL